MQPRQDRGTGAERAGLLDRGQEGRLHQVLGVDGGTGQVQGDAEQAERAEFALLERRGNTYIADHFESLTIQDGMIVIGSLTGGDYDLLLKDLNQTIRVRITDGEIRDDEQEEQNQGETLLEDAA